MQPEMITKAVNAIKQLAELKRKYKIELGAFIDENKDLEIFSTLSFLSATEGMSTEEAQKAHTIANVAIGRILAIPFEIDRLDAELQTLKSID